ncbi:hypothetical protein J3L18_10800 [Mucilaginibacter gossypii]|uniref:hypothetical protein n=1 Tax=Mucilaginibacter gossypii TaxID=551996 RepID=UPI000DCB3283|nr:MULTISPECIES: hypothetical protein [Mucilaginibacter]QTE39515.1 hypothetical protein J3L18_10800 [Mucilaginibacter gossypii]RAV56123.1 hypothetical protein DIU36_15320 [Mucilaginibacter rubeus]
MAYNSKNNKKKIAHIMSVYQSIKEADIPDTRIVAKRFPEHGINISYRTLMYYKSMKPSEYKEAS